MKRAAGLLSLLVLVATIGACISPQPGGRAVQAPPETKLQRDTRMRWWREARFGMFIHWGLYAIPAGEWYGRTDHGEWIMYSAQIPVTEYEQFREQFNPVRFDAAEWVRLAKDAGMKYIVITTKHHDGFCLFDSQYTDYDVMSTPFRRDVMKELAEAGRAEGLRICWYHSIMDWHHPDYLPRRPWDNRSTWGASFDRYYEYLKNQLRELLTNYGPIGILWFDGEWESTWTHEYGGPLYDYVRSLQPAIIVNNRVDKGRAGMAGLTVGSFTGDYGTPEQEVPATGLPGVDWETCMTMNDHWGYNSHDDNFKSTRELLRTLVDICSKGGNFLLNVGPTAEGEIPPTSVERLIEIGRWMKVNGDAIYGTQASPFKSLPWGRCTLRALPDNSARLYLHVFDWPANGRLVVPGLLNEKPQAYLLADPDHTRLRVKRDGDALVIRVPATAPDANDSVVVLEISGRPDVTDPPVITAPAPIFVDSLHVAITSDRENVELRYTLDGSDPTPASPRVDAPLTVSETTTVSARAFRGERIVSGVTRTTYTKVTPRPAELMAEPEPGVQYEYCEGDWDRLPNFDELRPVRRGTVPDFRLPPGARSEYYAVRYVGYVTVPRDGAYTFWTTSDDGSQLYIGDTLVVENDGLHGAAAKGGTIALAAGPHPITVTYFNKTGGATLEVSWAEIAGAKETLPAERLTHSRGGPVPTSQPPKEKAMPQPPTPSVEVAPQPGAPAPVPSPRQLAWQETELIAFIHFGPNTFTDREWGEGTEPPQLFNPTALDARQWARVCQAAGIKQLILTAKHHDGFCLWPSRYTAHSVKSSPWRSGQGDVVREAAEACRAAGLKFGLYLSPWDRHETCYGDSPRYNEYYKNQLTELLTNYGPISEVWFDGACGEGPNGKKQVYDWPGYIDVVRRLQPDAVIFSDAGPDVRWIGNEKGFAGETNWSTLRRDEFVPGTPLFAQLTEGHENGTHWVPAECDVSIRPGWFYHAREDDQVKSLGELLDIYYGSVGRNGVLLLNLPPDRRGLIHEKDAARLAEFHDVLAETFRTNLAAGRSVTASPVRPSDPEHGPDKTVDGDPHTAWTNADDVHSATLEVDLGAPTMFDRLMLMEDIRLGQRVRTFTVEAGDGTTWRSIAQGTTIGHKRLLRIAPTTASHVRLVIQDARSGPAVAEFGVFKASPREAEARTSR